MKIHTLPYNLRLMCISYYHLFNFILPMFFHCTERTHVCFFHRERDANRINYMYAQYVKNTMEPLNIPDVSKDKRFPWTVSKPILNLEPKHCFPIRSVLLGTPQLKAWPRTGYISE